MSRLKHYIMNEASYAANLGIIELVKFYQVASKTEIAEMEKIVAAED